MDGHQQSRRSVLGAATGLGLATLVLPAASAAASNVTPLESTTTTFTTAGTFSVPSGINSVIVTAEGTAGGVPPASVGDVTLKNGTAGRGGRVVATVAVTPGSDLDVVVGASVAGQPDPVTSLAPYPGGAGGAAVGVRSGSTWLVVAGGGGGGAGGGLAAQGTPVVYSSTSFVGGNGGDATGAASPVSATSGTTAVSVDPAAAGSSASGGTAGSGGSSPIGGPTTTDDGKNGTAFSATDLGAGGQAGVITNPGGGGGAGYAGGGGGGAHNSNGGGAGGGGGSNYVDGSATSVVQGYSARSLDDGVLLTIQTVVD